MLTGEYGIWTLRLLSAVLSLMSISAPTAGQSVTPDSGSKPDRSPPASSPTFGQVFRDLGGDFVKRLPSRENAIVLGVGGGLTALATVWDDELGDDVDPSSTDDVFEPGAVVGNFYVHLGAAFATYGIGRAKGNTRAARLGAELVRAQLVAAATTYGLKYAVDRTRPNGDPRSFPSGHSSTAFATATVLQRRFGWKAGVPAFAVASYVGASRIAVGKHYLSDVVFGATLGVVAGRTVTVGRAKFTISPLVPPGGGAGIAFNLAPEAF